MDATVTPGPAAPIASGPVSERSQARRETIRLLLRRRAFILGNLIVIGWIITAVLGQRITPYDPFNSFSGGHLPPSSAHLFGTDRLVFTTPFVAVGIIRYLSLALWKPRDDSPTDVMLRDPICLLDVVGAIAAVVVIIYG